MSEQNIESLLTERFFFSNSPAVQDDVSGFSELHLVGKDFAIPNVLFGLLKHIGCKPEGRWEKCEWVFSFNVKGLPCFVSSEKFGLLLHTPNSAGPTFARFVRGMLVIGNQKYSNLLKQHIEGTLSGTKEFGFINHVGFLRRGYVHFRESAEIGYSLGLHHGRTEEKNPNYTSISFNQEPWWNSFGATVLFFGYLEHLYSGLYGFTGTRRSVAEVQDFMSLSWRKKHHKLFVEAGIFDANQFSRLNEIIQYQRNLFAHGMSGKPGSSIYHLVSGVGFVPSTLSSELIQPNFMFSMEHQKTFETNCKEFDLLEDFLESSSLRFGMQWARSGMNFRFDSKFMDELSESIDSDNFDEFMEKQNYLTEQARNFEY